MVIFSKKIILLSFLTLLFTFPFIVRAQIQFQQSVSVPGFTETQVGEGTLAKYINAFYKWAVIAIAVFAVLMIVNAGFGMILNSGNVAKVTEKRDELFRAIIGLMLALVAVPMLGMINPILIRLSNLKIKKIERIAIVSPSSVGSYVLRPDYSFLSAGSDVEKLLDFGSGLHFCLYDENGSLDTKTGSGEYVGGSRTIGVAIYFPDNSRREAVAVKGTWKLKGGKQIYSLCNRTDGCGGGEDGWGATINSNLSYDECLGDGGFSSDITTCSKVFLWKKIGWAGDRGTPNDPLLETQQYGNFEIILEVISKRNEFAPQIAQEFFTQHCGLLVPVCSGGQRTGNETKCCKKKIEKDANNYYYDFCVLENSYSCNYFGGWEEETGSTEKSRYCGL